MRKNGRFQCKTFLACGWKALALGVKDEVSRRNEALYCRALQGKVSYLVVWTASN